MARLSILLLLVALSYLHTSEGYKIVDLCRRGLSGAWNYLFPPRPRQPQKAYDKLALVYTWGPGYCKKMPSKCNISSTANKTWTIHGLWPVATNPVDCTGAYNSSKMSAIRSKMDEKWPNYNNGGNNDDFWQHEYEKHGTCADDIPQLDSQEKYFSGTMDLYDKYDIKEILDKDGVSPVSPSQKLYSLADITSALKKELSGVEPAVYCVKKKKKQYLWEVRVCFDKKTLKPITCGTAMAGGQKCSSNDVIYEPFP